MRQNYQTTVTTTFRDTRPVVALDAVTSSTVLHGSIPEETSCSPRTGTRGGTPVTTRPGKSDPDPYRLNRSRSLRLRVNLNLGILVNLPRKLVLHSDMFTCDTCFIHIIHLSVEHLSVETIAAYRPPPSGLSHPEITIEAHLVISHIPTHRSESEHPHHVHQLLTRQLVFNIIGICQPRRNPRDAANRPLTSPICPGDRNYPAFTGSQNPYTPL